MGVIKYRRSKFEVYVELLHLMSEGETKPTPLMSSCNLSWVPLMRVVDLMKLNGHVEEREAQGSDGRCKWSYHLTQDGVELVGHLRHYGLIKIMRGLNK